MGRSARTRLHQSMIGGLGMGRSVMRNLAQKTRRKFALRTKMNVFWVGWILTAALTSNWLTVAESIKAIAILG
jgi:hypothetical protein